MSRSAIGRFQDKFGRANLEKSSVSSKQLIPREQGSDCVASLEYDVDHQQLTIHFNQRGSYVYFDVSPFVFAELNLSTLRGEYFNAYIRGQYAYERLN